MKNTMLLFDLDGTLWDSAKAVAESWNIVLHRDYPDSPHLTVDDIHAVMGKTMDEIAETIAVGIPSDKRAVLFHECEEYEITYVAEHGGILFDGVKDTLEQLKEEGYQMAIVSNCQTGYINAFYQSMRLQDYFCDMEEWGNTRRCKADNIRLVMERNGFENGIYIGDTDKDESAAKGAGIPFIHASYGFGKANDPDAVIVSISELPALLKKI